MKKAPWDFIITWYWRSDGKDKLKTNQVKATSVPRAISKLKKDLGAEYDNVNTELVVVDVANLHLDSQD